MIRGWFLVSAAIPLLLFVIASWYDREVTADRAREGMAAATHALAEHAQAVMQSASLALTLQLDQIRDLEWQEIDHSRRVHEFLTWLVQQMPQLDSAFYVNAEGYNSASSRAFPMPPYDDRQREYFERAKADTSNIVVSSIFNAKSTGTPSFVVSRARMKDGHFDGVAALTLSPIWFRTFYKRVLLWRDGASAGLFRADGIVLVRYPDGGPISLKLPAGSTVMQALAKGGTSGVLIGRSSMDGAYKMLAFRRLPDADIVVVYGLLMSAVLAPWHQHVAIFAVFAIVASAALLIIAYRTVDQSERERTNLAGLLEETERRQRAEAALQHAGKMEALGRLTGGVAHDFNNLLAAILGSLELALSRTTEARVQRPLEVARQAGQRGAKLVAQMLAFARNHVVEAQCLDLNAVLSDAESLIHRTAGPLVRVDEELEPGLWLTRADPVQFELALLNVVANARDAMPEGGALFLRTRNLSAKDTIPPGLPPGKYVMIAISDNGPGMPESVKQRAFEPFFTTKELGKGTGLGLSMVYGFARQLGGTATIESSPGRGTSVAIFLPRTHEETVTPGIPADPGLSKTRPLRVLLVDDDAAVRASVHDMLDELGYRTIEADNGVTALEHLRGEEAFDLLIADFAMPGMNGRELAEGAIRMRPDLPILLISGYVDPAQFDSRCSRGQLLHKPFDLTALATAVQKAVSAMKN